MESPPQTSALIWRCSLMEVRWCRVLLSNSSHLFQDALVEELLQLLVTVVDAELLKAVVLKVLCKYISYTMCVRAKWTITGSFLRWCELSKRALLLFCPLRKNKLSNQQFFFSLKPSNRNISLSFKDTFSIKTLKFWCFVVVVVVIIVILTKASDVQDADEVGGGVEGEALVDSGHHVVKQTAVHGLCQGVPGIVGLLDFERHSGENTKITGLNKSEI